MEILCRRVKKLSINNINEYEENIEYKLLFSATYNIDDINSIDTRYLRYLKKIKIWTIDNVTYENIKNNIIFYLSVETTKDNLDLKLEFAKKIDNQLKQVLNKHL